jgi:hypothetical protein
MFGLNKNHYLGIGLLALLSLGQLQRINTPFFAFYAHDVLIFVWLSYLLTSHKNIIIKQLSFCLKNHKPIVLSIAFISLWVGMGWFWQLLNQNLTLWPFAYSLRFLVYSSLVVSLVLVNKKNNILSKHDIGYGLEVFFPIIIFFGWLQYWLLPDTRMLAVLGWDDHLGRMIGTQFDPNFFGLILVFAGIWSTLQHRLTKNSRFLLLSLVTSISIVITWSRSTYLAYIAFLGVYCVWSFSNFKKFRSFAKVIVFQLMVFTLGFLFLQKPIGEGGDLTRLSSVYSRIENNRGALLNLKGFEIIVGKGLFNVSETSKLSLYQRANHSKLATSLPAIVVSGVGYGGVILLVGSLFYLMKKYQFFSHKFSHHNLRSLTNRYPMLTLSLTATLTHSLANASITQPFIFLLLLSFFIYESSD